MSRRYSSMPWAQKGLATVAVAMGTAVVAMGTAGRIMGTAVVAMGTVVVATGAATGTAFFFLDRKGTLIAPVQMPKQQQMPSARRNQAHQGQPPPSVVVAAISQAGVKSTGTAA